MFTIEVLLARRFVKFVWGLVAVSSKRTRTKQTKQKTKKQKIIYFRFLFISSFFHCVSKITRNFVLFSFFISFSIEDFDLFHHIKLINDDQVVVTKF